MPIVKLGLASPLGSGNQYIPLVSMDDLLNLYEFIILNPQLTGTFNANAPCHVTNKQLMFGLAKILDKPFIMPAVPAFILKIIYGEFASVLLEGSRVSSNKLIDSGFTFSHDKLESMLESVF